MRKNKEPVRLRTKPLNNGNKSLYLDIYVNGARTYEFLKMYLIPESSKADKLRNAETMRMAEAVKAMRVLDIQAGRYNLKSPIETKYTLLDFFDLHLSGLDIRESTIEIWKFARKHVCDYFGEGKLISSVSSSDIQAFRNFLAGKNLVRSSVKQYDNKLKSVIRHAHRRGIITTDPYIDTQPIRCNPRERMYLTAEELKRVASVDIAEHIRNPFLFSCLTGLRHSDIKKLTWGDVKTESGRTRLVFSQQKTDSLEYLDINSQAVSLMGAPGAPEDKVFPRLPSSNMYCQIFGRWMERAGVKKHISFHCARHTFAVMMISLGADIYTVQKLLGHTQISTTQIYAKILDKQKRDAVDMIPDIGL